MHAFFLCKNKLYLRTPTLRFAQKNNHQAKILTNLIILFNSCTQIEMYIKVHNNTLHENKDLLEIELAGSSGAGRVISKLITFVDAALTVSSFYRIPLDETCSINKHVFLRVFLLLRATNPLFRNIRK